MKRAITHVRYVGPRNQLRGKTTLARMPSRAEREQFPQFAKGFLFCQFDDRNLVAGDVQMGFNWHPIRIQYLKLTGHLGGFGGQNYEWAVVDDATPRHSYTADFSKLEQHATAHLARQLLGIEGTEVQTILVDDETYDRITNIINSDAPPTQALIDLMQRKPAWVDQTDPLVDRFPGPIRENY